MTDKSEDRPLPPSYDEAMQVPSAPQLEPQPYPGQPAYPPYASSSQSQPPYPSAGPTQPGYGSSAQAKQPYPYAGQQQPPYGASGQPQQSYPSGQPGATYPYQGTQSTAGYTYPPQVPYGHGGQPGQVQYSSVPGQPAQYTHSMVTAAPNVVNTAGYQTTPQGQENTYQAAAMVFCFIFFLIIISIIFTSIV